MSDFVHVEAEFEADDGAQLGTAQLKTPSRPDLEFLKLHPFVKQTVVDKIFGCILGSALGDTIGLYTEFLPKHACDSIYPERKFSLVEPVTELHGDSHRNRFERRAWTDDTDQALLILLSYLHNNSSTDILDVLSIDFASRLKVWVEQGLLALDRNPCGIGALVGSVVGHAAYLHDPFGVATARWTKTGRYVAPNGSLMRTHPIGVICVGLPEEEAWRLSVAVGRTTHVDPRCVVACCISVGIIRGLLRGEILIESDVDEAIERAFGWVTGQPELMNPGLDTNLTKWEIERHLDRKEFERHVYAKDLDELKLDNKQEMGYVYKCLGSAILTLRLGMRATQGSAGSPNMPFEKLMTDLIMEGGDSDTNAAVAGALLGTYVGYSTLPPQWANGLAHKEWLNSKVIRLITAIGIINGNLEEERDEAADGGKGLMNEEELKKRDRAFLMQILARDREQKERDAKKKQPTRLKGWFK